MKLKSRNKITEPEDAREAFHKSERQYVRQEKVQKLFSLLFVIIAVAIIAFVIYAYFIDKPEFIPASITDNP